MIEKLQILNFIWVDERCVSPDSDESNFKMANEYLFTDKIFRSENIYRIKGENDPFEEVKIYNNILKKIYLSLTAYLNLILLS